MVRLATNAMATRFELVLEGADRVQLLAVGELAIERIDEAHRALTRYEASSLLAHLRRVAPRMVAVDAPILGLFEAINHVVVASEGRFDPSLGCGWDRVRINHAESTLGFADPDLDLDLGGIGKGYAIDLAVATFKEYGIESAFIHGGTSSGYGLGSPKGTSGWNVRFARNGGPTISLCDQGYAVSATHQARDGELVGQLVDPWTGALVRESRRVAVIGPSAALADGWATAALLTAERPMALSSAWQVWLQRNDQPWIAI